MPAKDVYHDTVRNALIKDGWTITADPLRLAWGRRQLFVDLGAERLLGAEKGDRRIAVEIKSFVGTSEVADLETALGQFLLYRRTLMKVDSTRELHLAVPRKAFFSLFNDEIGQELLTEDGVNVLVFDPSTEEIVRWAP